MTTLLLAKLLVSIVVVLGLSLIAERLSPRVAGVLSGYPLGTAILLYFIAVEQGRGFAAQSAVFAVAGFAATLAFLYAYHRAVRIGGQMANWAGALLGSIAGLAAFLAVSLAVVAASPGLMAAIALTLAALAAAMIGFRAIENQPLTTRVRLTLTVLGVRAGLAAAIVIGVSGAAATIGPKWAGLFSGFPITLYPLILILHLTYGAAPVHTVVKNFPFGMGALLAYTITVALLYEPLGLIVGTLAAFAVATVYLLLYSGLERHWRRR